jgi:hypothetical protein
LELGEVRGVASSSEACADLPPAGWHPVGHRVEWHPPTL